MKIEKPNAKDPTPEEVRELEKLKAMVELFIADGVITPLEFQALRTEVFAHGTPSAEQLYRELELYRKMVTEKIQSGELREEAPGI
jgi:uncharacterized membrane protein YebE (DUF533 family)